MADKDIKPISINPELFKVSSAQFSNNAKTLKKRNSKINPTQIKKDLLEKIKRKSRKPKEQLIESQNNETQEFRKEPESSFDNEPEVKDVKNKDVPSISVIIGDKNNKFTSPDSDDDFSQSIEYLKNLSLKREKKKKNIIKSSLDEDFPIKKNIFDNITNDSPKFGCLKGGSLPTFRQFHNQTLKFNSNNNTRLVKPSNKTIKYSLGKKGKIVSVLFKNRESSKKIINECKKLNETNIIDMKNYLKRHNFLKSGTLAPPEIIKKMYEQCLLAGDIRNLNKKSIVHNYLAN
jgi:hypothetical protein